jgi:hypothetical protein
VAGARHYPVSRSFSAYGPGAGRDNHTGLKCTSMTPINIAKPLLGPEERAGMR